MVEPEPAPRQANPPEAPRSFPRHPHDIERAQAPALTPLPRTAAERFAMAVRGPLLGLCVNLVLVVVKAIGGVLSGSAALLADAGHSGADVANNVLVLASLIYARRPADETHPYGHDRAEVLAAIGSAYLLGAAGIYFGWDSIQKLIRGTPTPTSLAVWVAIGTLVVKVVVARMETAIARDVVSQAVLADARDNLADVLSSLAVIIGVVGARLGAHWLDGAAGLAIAMLILGTAIHIAITAGNELLEPNLSESILGRVRQAAAGVAEVHAVTAVTGHAHGSDVLVELSIEVDPQLEVARAAAIADEIRQAIYAAVPEVGDATVELNTDHVARLRSRLR